MKVSVKKSMRCPIFKEGSAEPWARISDILLDGEKTRVVAVTAATESLVPLRKNISADSIYERNGFFYTHGEPADKYYCPGSVSCVNEVFRLKSAGGSRVLDICFEPELWNIVSVTVGGFLNRKSINIIHHFGSKKEMNMK